MKPIYTAVIRRGDREHVMAFPFTSRRIKRTEIALGYTPDFDTADDDGYIAEYRSRIGAPPDKDVEMGMVHDAAVSLECFTPAQIRAMKSLNGAFGLSFWDTKGFLAFLAEAKAVTPEYIAEYGVPAGYGPEHEGGGE